MYIHTRPVLLTQMQTLPAERRTQERFSHRHCSLESQTNQVRQNMGRERERQACPPPLKLTRRVLQLTSDETDQLLPRLPPLTAASDLLPGFVLNELPFFFHPRRSSAEQAGKVTKQMTDLLSRLFCAGEGAFPLPGFARRRLAGGGEQPRRFLRDAPASLPALS